MLINIVDKKDEHLKHARSGFLALGTVFGFLVGYCIADWTSRSIGHGWYANPHSQYFDFTVRCLIAGPILGLMIGFLADAFVVSDRHRKKILEFGLIALAIAVVLYALTGPAMTGVRE